ncbi:hypothetical protein WMQ73_004738, partial [Enterobacter hormaechei]
VMAGCSNENTGAVVVILSGIYYLYNAYIIRSLRHRGLIYTLLSLAGFIALIAAPGNYERAKSFSAWYSKPLIERLVEHLYSRIPDVISIMWPLFLAFTIIALINLLSEKTNKKSTTLALIFLFAALSTSLIMFAAPSYPPRAANGTLILVLIAVSFLLKDSFFTLTQKYLTCSLFALVILYFIPQYLWMYESY